jgi:DNA-binding transcriptional ArsR family regulator
MPPIGGTSHFIVLSQSPKTIIDLIFGELLKINLRKSKLARLFARNYLRIMTQTRDVFQAIADPTRRQIIGMLARKSLNVNAIAKEFDITRQAVSLHVQFLNDCGLIVIKQQGRERYCEAKLEKLNEVTAWVDQYRKYWDNKLDSLESYLARIQKKKK